MHLINLSFQSSLDFDIVVSSKQDISTHVRVYLGYLLGLKQKLLGVITD